MLIGSVANGLNFSSGFRAGSRVVDHQCINRTLFVFSAAVPALLAVSASESLNILWNTRSILRTLQENVRAIRAVLDRIDSLTIPLHAVPPIIHIHIRTATPSLTVAAGKAPNPPTAASRDAPSLQVRRASCRTSWTRCSCRVCDHKGSAAAWAGAR